MLRKSLIAAGLVAAAAIPAHADVPLTLNVGVGEWAFDNDLDVFDHGTPILGLEWALNNKWALELMYAEDETDTISTNMETEVKSWSLGALRYAGDSTRFRPYVGLGMGELELENNSWDDVQTALNAAMGMRFMFTDRLGARVEMRAVHTLDNDDTNILLNAGLNFFFGSTAPKTKVMEVVEEEVVVGDSDGDGVNDNDDQCPGTEAGVRVDSFGCPLPVAQVASIRMMVNFATDSAVVTERYFSDIAELAAFLQRFKDVDVMIEGHTDNTGPEAYNQKLSQRRANAVADVLANEHGIARSRLQAKGYGESNPIASNDTAEGRAENRRVMATLEVEYSE